MGEIVRGRVEGVGAFFTSSPLPLYRPLQSLLMFLATMEDPAQPALAIRLLHFGSALLLASVAVA